MDRSDEQWRAWAVEQIVKHHGGTGSTPVDRVIGEAKQLLEYVRPSKAVLAPPEK